MQLHEFVDAVTADEPPMARTADDIVAAGRRAERRRRAGFASAGAAGLVVVAVAGAFVLPTFGAEQQNGTTGGAPAPVGAATGKAPEAKWADAAPFSFTFKGYDAGSLQVQDPIAASTTYQIASVYSDGHTSNDKPMTREESEALTGDALDQKRKAAGGKPSLYAYLTVYKTGAFDPAGIKNGKDGTVAGRKTVQATLPVGLDPKNAVDEGNKLFAWEYADNAWAAVTSVSSDPATPSFEDLGGLVEGLKPTKAEPALLPFTVTYLPSGYVPLQIGEGAMPGLTGISTAREGNYGGATFTKPAGATSGLTAPYDQAEDGIKDGFHIFVNPASSSNQEPEPGKSQCMEGSADRQPDRSGGFCNVWSADGKVSVQVSSQGLGGKLNIDEVRKIAAGIKVADVKDKSTWTPAADALTP